MLQRLLIGLMALVTGGTVTLNVLGYIQGDVLGLWLIGTLLVIIAGGVAIQYLEFKKRKRSDS